MLPWRLVAGVLAGGLLLGPWCAGALGDGGSIRLSEQKGAYRITVFTSPIPFRAGPVDISVLVQDAASGTPLPDVRVDVEVTPRGRPGEAISNRATTEAATNKLFQAAVFELPEPGWWEVAVTVEGPKGTARVTFEVEAAAPLPRWLSLWPWVCWPAGAMLLFCIHLWLVRRKAVPRLNATRNRDPVHPRSVP
jgi:hypothetical protein